MAIGLLSLIVIIPAIIIAALLICLWAVPLTITGRGELSQAAPTLLFTVLIHWGALSLRTDLSEEQGVTVFLFGRRVFHFVPKEETAVSAVKTTEETKAETKDVPAGEIPKEEPQQPEKREALPDIIGLADAVIPQVRILLRRISIDHLRASLRFGLGDAALTGEVFGLLMAIRGILMATGGKVSLAAAPVFEETIIEGDSEGALRIAHPLSLVPPVIRVIRHPAVWRMVRSR